MTTKTDFHAIMELKEKYTPKRYGIVYADEAEIIKKVLEIEERTPIELQNIRDMVVMLYGQWADVERRPGEDSGKLERELNQAYSYMDAMSAITYIIDAEKIGRGMEV